MGSSRTYRSQQKSEMAVHLNRVLPNAHFRKRKTWAKLAKTWFNQPAKKEARRSARAAKAVAVAPRPVAGSLRPVVQCPTFRYNAKARVGRGFTYDEVKGAGMSAIDAVQLGICIDKRRKNKSAENLQRNVQRLKEYRQKLVVLKKGAATDVEQNVARKIMPVTNVPGKVESARSRLTCRRAPPTRPSTWPALTSSTPVSARSDASSASRKRRRRRAARSKQQHLKIFRVVH